MCSFLNTFLDSRHFQLAKYIVVDGESDVHVKNKEFQHSEAKNEDSSICLCFNSFFVRFVTRFAVRFLTRFSARVLTGVWGRGKTINTVYSTTRPNEKP